MVIMAKMLTATTSENSFAPSSMSLFASMMARAMNREKSLDRCRLHITYTPKVRECVEAACMCTQMET